VRKLAAACTLLLSFAVTSVASAATLPSHLRYAVGANTTMNNVPQAVARNRVFILQAWQTDRLHAIKDADPSATVIVYKNLSAMASSPRVNGRQSTGVGADEAASHPDWYLLNTSGQKFNYWGYSFLWAADVGNPGYEQTWADNVSSELKANGWDGVFMDDTTLTLKYHYNISEIAKYKTDASWQAATKAMLAVVSPKIHAAGKKVYANVGAWVEYRAAASSWLPYLDGAMDEMYLKYTRANGKGYRGESQWTTQLDELKETEAAGKTFLGLTQSSADDAAAARFGWASTLLVSNGNSNYSMTGGDEEEHWFPEYDYALGNPTGPATVDANGIRRRAFQNGLVLVNPKGSTLTAAFGGTYSGSGLTSATSGSLPLHSALVLTEDPAPVVVPPVVVPPVVTPPVVVPPVVVAPVVTPPVVPPLITSPVVAPSVETPSVDTTPVDTSPVDTPPVDTLLVDTSPAVPAAVKPRIKLRINFQPAGAKVPSGYLADTGAAFTSARGYGWVREDTVRSKSAHTPLSLVLNTRKRTGTDTRMTTLIHMQYPASAAGTASRTPGAWEAVVPNGTYTVTVGVGDASFIDSINRINIEGASALTFKPTTAKRTTTVTKQVIVTDGRMSIDAIGGTNAKIDYVDITTV
jgi:hypothetical protein